MKRHTLVTAACSVVLTALMLPTARANEPAAEFAPPPLPVPGIIESGGGNSAGPSFTGPSFNGASPAPAKLAVLLQSDMQPVSSPQPLDVGAGTAGPQSAPQQPGYPHLGAPMYPSPRPNIPIWTGSTMITNQAFAPHEMLYPHTYRAIYPPFYHRVKGGWILTPFGVRSHEHWELQGTQVQVKYRSQYPGLLKGAWHPPATSSWGRPWD